MNKTSNSKAAEACLKILNDNCESWMDHCLVSLTLLCVAFKSNEQTYEQAHNNMLKLIDNGIFEEAYNAIKVDKHNEQNNDLP